MENRKAIASPGESRPGLSRHCEASASASGCVAIDAPGGRTGSFWTALVVVGCIAGAVLDGRAASVEATAGTQPKAINIWTHEDAGSREFKVLKEAAGKFNRRQHVYRVEITSSLRRDYEGWVHRAAATGSLPCLLEFDGPLLAEFAWSQYLQPIDRFAAPGLLNDFLPSIVAQGTYQGRLYSLGQYDSGVGLWGNRRYLRAAGVRIPTLEFPWSLEEFEQVLAKLAALKDLDYAINFSIYVRHDEFYSYAYAPILQGFGGDLIDRRSFHSARGVLDGPQSVAAMKHFQQWVQKGWTRVVSERQNDFVLGKAALTWTGHWGYPAYHQALGKNLLLLPLPDFGRGIKTGMGSWAWGISSTCHEPAGAWAFLVDLLSPGEIVQMTNINGAMPARHSALARSPLYGPRGPLRFFVRQLGVGGVPRPTTPVYGTISKTFAEAVGGIVAGADVQSALSQAVDIIDQTIVAHHDYPYP
jgi:multiple sugar transport system substrate-binding protein